MLTRPGEDPDVFFPSHGGPGAKARKICVVCAVREQCLDDAVKADKFGIWADLDQQERRNLRKTRQRGQKTARPWAGKAVGTTGARWLPSSGACAPRLRPTPGGLALWPREDAADTARSAFHARLQRQVDPPARSRRASASALCAPRQKPSPLG